MALKVKLASFLNLSSSLSWPSSGDLRLRKVLCSPSPASVSLVCVSCVCVWCMCVCVCVVAQSYPTLCDPVNCSPPGSSVHGILQARILEWVAISFRPLLASKSVFFAHS